MSAVFHFHTKNSCGVDIHPVLKEKGGKVLGISVGWSDPINKKILNDLLVSFISKATLRVCTKTNHTPTPIISIVSFFLDTFWTNPINFQKKKKEKEKLYDSTDVIQQANGIGQEHT